MTYQVLANKYRPKQFIDLIGQSSTVDTLTYALGNDKLHHAYIFSGTRGIGKTSTARIFAMALNCAQKQTEPCGECPSCQRIQSGCDIDVTEIDAASKSKVDEIRDILEQMHYPPTQSRYKVYLIDEIHMLSTHSFNALLKTIESPPSFVKFLFATTDPQKIPKTIHSRCIEFKLQAFTQNAIETRLEQILTKESIPFEKEALERISQAGQGSMRDALTLLDQAIAYGKGALTQKTTQQLLGLASQEMIEQIMNAIESEDSKELINLCEQIKSQHLNIEIIIYQIMRFIHQSIKKKILNNEKAGLEQLQLYYQMCEQAQTTLAWQPTTYIGFEVLCLRLCCFKLEQSSLASLVLGKIPSKPTRTPQPTASVQQKNYNAKQTISPGGLSGIAKQVMQNATVRSTENEVTILIPESMKTLLNERIKSQICAIYQQEKPNRAIKFDTQQIATTAPALPAANDNKTKQPKVNADIESAIDILGAKIQSVESQ